MLFWRQKSFEDIKTVAALAAAQPNGWADYANYCLEQERGLRSRAFECLEKFILAMEKAPFDERRRFISWLLHVVEGRNYPQQLIPHPLKLRLVEPTLLEWTMVEPNCAEPHIWLGDQEHLEKALSLDPMNYLAKRKFVRYLLNQLNYATHELPWGYLGSPHEDLLLIQRAKSLVQELPDENERGSFSSTFDELQTAIHEYLKRR